MTAQKVDLLRVIVNNMNFTESKTTRRLVQPGELLSKNKENNGDKIIEAY